MLKWKACNDSKYWDNFFWTFSMLAGPKFLLKQQVIGASKSNFYKNFMIFSGNVIPELWVCWQETSSSKVASQQPKCLLKIFRYRPFLQFPNASLTLP